MNKHSDFIEKALRNGDLAVQNMYQSGKAIREAGGKMSSDGYRFVPWKELFPRIKQ